jgi:hypothetical protein
MRLVQVDQPMAVAHCPIQRRLQALQESPPLGRIGAAKQFLGLLPGQPQPMQRGTDGLAAIKLPKPLLNPVHEPPQRPAWRHLICGRGLGGGGLGRADYLSEPGFDLSAKGGRPPVRR